MSAAMSAGGMVLTAAGGFGAGAVNAIAGGGSLISFPILLSVGYGPLTANMTNTVGLLPGYLGGSFAYRAQLRDDPPRSVRLGAAAAAGAVLGSVVLMVTPARVFASLAPVLVLVASILLGVQPWVARRAGAAVGHRHGPVVAAAIAGAYGAYFNAGLGVVIIALLGAVLAEDLQRLNALKGAMSFAISAVATVLFALFGPVAWPIAGMLATTSLVGGQVGGMLARRLPAAAIRVTVVAAGLVIGTLLMV